MKEAEDTAGLPRVERRAIEAQAVAPVIRAVAERIGWEEAQAILIAVNQSEAHERGRALADQTGQKGIDELARDVAGWGRGGCWEMEVLQQTSSTYFFNVTRCPYHERYAALGLDDLGVALSCCRDEPFARGLNPRLRLERTQTLMEGGDHCDFRYFLDDH